VRTSFRIEWAAVPAPVRALVEERLGSAVVSAVNETGGYSPSLAARCGLANGRRCFVKAGSAAATNDRVVEMLRAEAALCSAFPVDGSFPAPALQLVVDDGEWVVVVFEEVAGRNPVQPWRPSELSAVVDALDGLPTPPGLPLRAAAERLVGTFGGFARVAADPAGVTDGWTLDHLDELVALEAGWPAACAGEALVHSDVRDDNVLLADDGRVLLVDWAHSFVGADWLDLLFALPSVELAGGPPPDELAARSVRLRRADPDAVTVAAVALLGFFTDQARHAPPPGAPAVRAFQEAQRRVARRWVEQRLA
jgi:aminoglycoside phosphotransferase (APT) family kinase protein